MTGKSFCRRDDLEEVVAETFALMANTRVQPTIEFSASCREPLVVACVHVVGVWSGSLCLVWSDSQTRTVVSQVVGKEANDLKPAEVEDCLRELANMVGGNIKPLIGHGAILSPPKLVYCQNFEPAAIGGIGCESIFFKAQNWGVQLVISQSDFEIDELWQAHGLTRGNGEDKSMKILIVEDEPVSQKILSNILSGYGTIKVASDGLEGYKLFADSLEKREPFDLVCLDIMMPHVPGLEVLQKIRKDEAAHGMHGLAGTKVIMTSALDDGQNVLGSFRAGCEAYIVKPIDRTQVLDTILKLFGDRIAKNS